MKVLQANSGILTNTEVLAVLEDRGCAGNAPQARSLASEKMVYQYLSGYSAGSLTQIETFKELLAPYDLARIEVLQLANLAPTSAVEVHLIVEKCDERLSEDQVDGILELIAKHFPKEERAQS